MSAERATQPRRADEPGRRPLIDLRLGTAPVSYGIYGATAGELGAPVDTDLLLSCMAAGGYAGSELGPPGLFGNPPELADSFARAGLEVVGGYVPLHLSDPEALEDDLYLMEKTLDELSANHGDPGLAILADVGTPELMASPARSWNDRRLALDDDGWVALAEGIRRATALTEARSITTSFHPHISTYVESPWEVERLLALTPISLTLDIGHLQLTGADPVECFEAWETRINHVHLKDLRTEIMYRAKDRRATDFDEWWDTICCPLGTGDVDVSSLLDRLVSSGYSGWVIVEQDRRPTAAADYRAVEAEQARNAAWVREQLQTQQKEP